MLVLLLTVMISVINSNEFKMALALQEPETIWELKKRPERYIQREEVAGTTINRGGKKGQLAKERMGQEKEKDRGCNGRTLVEGLMASRSH
jgi:hypothetical protein